jgi:hypothetical protein
VTTNGTLYDVNAKDKQGKTPLCTALDEHHEDMPSAWRERVNVVMRRVIMD